MGNAVTISELTANLQKVDLEATRQQQQHKHKSHEEEAAKEEESYDMIPSTPVHDNAAGVAGFVDPRSPNVIRTPLETIARREAKLAKLLQEEEERQQQQRQQKDLDSNIMEGVSSELATPSLPTASSVTTLGPDWVDPRSPSQIRTPLEIENEEKSSHHHHNAVAVKSVRERLKLEDKENIGSSGKNTKKQTTKKNKSKKGSRIGKSNNTSEVTSF